MNIALSALIIILLLTPSISFRFAISSNSQLKELISTPTFTDTFWRLIFVPLLIHLILILSFYRLGYVIKFDLLLSLLKDKNDLSIIDNYQFFIDVCKFIGYLFIATFLTFLLGKLVVLIVIDNNDEIRWVFAKYIGTDNNWYRLFDGQIIKYSGEFDELKERIDLIKLDILVKTDPFPILYSGFFVNYYLKPGSKELENIVIQYAYKRHVIQTNLENEIVTDSFSDPVTIPGDYFIIPYSQVANLNMSYITVEDFNLEELVELGNIEDYEELATL